MIMDLNIQKEEFSYAYLQAVVSNAGYIFQRTTTPLDRMGIDATITGIGEGSLRNFPQLYVQVKCTSTEILTENELGIHLRLKTMRN